MPELDRAGKREDGDGGGGNPADYVGGDHDAAPLEPVGDDASDEDEEGEQGVPRQPDQREGGRRVRELVDLPGEGDDVHAVPGATRPPRPTAGRSP